MIPRLNVAPWLVPLPAISNVVEGKFSPATEPLADKLYCSTLPSIARSKLLS